MLRVKGDYDDELYSDYDPDWQGQDEAKKKDKPEKKMSRQEFAVANCGGPRPASFKEGDWMCRCCGNHNWAKRTECNKCGARKGMSKTQQEEERAIREAALAEGASPVFASANLVPEEAEDSQADSRASGVQQKRYRAKWEDAELNVLEKAQMEAEADWGDFPEDLLLDTEELNNHQWTPRDKFIQRCKDAEPSMGIKEHVEKHQLGRRKLEKLPRGMHRPVVFSGSDPAHNGQRGSTDDGSEDQLGRMANAVAKGFMRQRASSYCNGIRAQPGVYPRAERPEFAFIGASNVGKSSLMNALTRTQKLAEARDEPGVTRNINWYKCSRLPADVVDLPGFGFARGADFGPTLADFVATRRSLQALYFLLDARYGLRPSDWKWLRWLGRDGPEKIFILTKCDLVLPKDLTKVATVVLKDLKKVPKASQRLIMVSAREGQGMHDLRMEMCARGVDLANRARRRAAKRKARLADQVSAAAVEAWD